MKIFKLFDEDGTGKISFKNIKKISQELGKMKEREFQYIF